MKISNAVFDYHSDLYLIFFKCNITDLQLSNAIAQKDLSAIQQNSSALASYSEEGLEKIKLLKPYKTDVTLINSTKKCLEFYKKTSAEQIPSIIDFFMFNSKFETTRQNLEKKKQADRTKEEVDNYNGMVKDVNLKITNFNKVNSKFDQEKTQHINNWNNTASQFISIHVPNE